jgi:hypothetical protein
VASKTSPSKVHKCRDKFDRHCPDCWDKRLKAMRLTMDRGRKVGSVNIDYGKDVAVEDWFDVQSRAFVPPDGERLDKLEWPISLC